MLIDLQEAKDRLRHGHLIAVPTDTVYGIAADVQNDQAILKLYNLKKRRAKKPLVIQLSDTHELDPYLSLVPFDLERITQRFWPGALTLVLPIKEEKVSPIVRSQLPTAAFRIANCKKLRSLIKEYGPLAISSANLSGESDPESVEEIEEVFGKDFPVLADEISNSGLASTVLAYIDASWVILRKGGLSLKELSSVIGYNPPVVSNIDFKNVSYDINTQLHCMEQPYDGSIKVVLGLEDKDYPGAEKVIAIGPLKNQSDVKTAIINITQQIQKDSHAHIWVDMNFPKEGHHKELLRILERSFETDL